MTKELLNQFEDFKLFAENIEKAVEAAYCNVTVWLNYVDGRVLTSVEC